MPRIVRRHDTVAMSQRDPYAPSSMRSFGFLAVTLLGLASGCTARGTSHAAGAAHTISDPYRDTVHRIVVAALADDGAYRKLTQLTDRIGNRLSGSAALDDAIAWAQRELTADGH